MNDPALLPVFVVVLAALTLGTLVSGALYLKQVRSEQGVSTTVENLVQRVRAWWVMVGVLLGTSLLGPQALFGLYLLLSWLALREFISLTPTHRADHLAVAFAFFVVAPIQYWIAASCWYHMFLIFVPVYAFVAIPVLLALRGEPSHFLDRSAKLQWGVLVAVYFTSYVPMLQHVAAGNGSGARLTFFLAVVAQLSDVLQYTFGKLFGKHKISPTISPNKTIEGFVLGGSATIAVGAAMHSVTPFAPTGAALLSALIVVFGFLGGIVMSAVKRSLGAKDWGNLIGGHGGVFDRLDSIVFSAPIYFHVVVYMTDTDLPNRAPAWLFQLTH